MSPESWLDLLKQHRAIAVIRASDPVQGYQMAEAVADAGLRLIEITWNSADAATIIPQLRRDRPDCTVGTGTVLDQAMLHQAIAAGAQFVFSPHINRAMIQTAVEQKVPIIPGALTPTEIMTAWQAGSYSVKVFPVGAIGGVQYVQSLQGPLGEIPLIPTGGVTLENAAQFLGAGAIAIGLSSQLFPKPLVAAGHWDQIRRRAAALVERLQTNRVD